MMKNKPISIHLKDKTIRKRQLLQHQKLTSLILVKEKENNFLMTLINITEKRLISQHKLKRRKSLKVGRLRLMVAMNISFLIMLDLMR